MSGIIGSIRTNELVDEQQLADARDLMAHRGPDDVGILVGGSVGLGFRRLTILDLSKAGHQPMKSDDGRVTLVFNGEIYNFRELAIGVNCFGRSLSSRFGRAFASMVRLAERILWKCSYE